MKLTAKDTLFISSVKSDNILPGEAFEVSDAEGARLIERELAVKLRAPPKNKMAHAPANKGGGARKAK